MHGDAADVFVFFAWKDRISDTGRDRFEGEFPGSRYMEEQNEGR